MNFSGYMQVVPEEGEQGETITNCSNSWTWYPSEKRMGWECPKCGRVYAPWVSQCQHCGGWDYWRYPWYPQPYWVEPYGTWCDTDTAGTITVSGDYQVVYNGQSGTQILGNN